MQGYLPFVFVDFVFSDIIDDVSRDELIFTSLCHITSDLFTLSWAVMRSQLILKWNVHHLYWRLYYWGHFYYYYDMSLLLSTATVKYQTNETTISLFLSESEILLWLKNLFCQKTNIQVIMSEILSETETSIKCH